MSVRNDTFGLSVRNKRAPAAHGFETAAGYAVAARGGFRDAGPANREPTARSQIAAGIPALRGGGGCQVSILPVPADPVAAGRLAAMGSAESGQRLLLVHAHPDDESIGTGATMARYAAEG